VKNVSSCRCTAYQIYVPLAISCICKSRNIRHPPHLLHRVALSS
jgi:hypothetical protein